MGSDLTRDAVLVGASTPTGNALDAALFIAGRAIDVTADHAAAKTWAAEMLEACGLIPTVRTLPPPAGINPRPRATPYGRCQVCRRKKPLRVDGTVVNHQTGSGASCNGGTLPPKEDA